MDDFLVKPIQAANLWAAMDRVVAARGPAAPPEPGLLDPHLLLAACGGDAVILEKICKAFRARLPDHVAAVQDALGEQDSLRLREAAHKLCGMVSAFSSVAGGLASDIEDLAAQGRLEDARPLAAKLHEMAGALMQDVDGLSIENLGRTQARRRLQTNERFCETTVDPATELVERWPVRIPVRELLWFRDVGWYAAGARFAYSCSCPR